MGNFEIELSEDTIEKIFGKEAAEDENPDRLKEYFFKNEAYQSMIADSSLRILVGHKGVGKSALLKVARLEDNSKNTLSIMIKPDDIYDISSDKEDFNEMIRAWKSGLQKLIFHKLLENFGVEDDGMIGDIKVISGKFISVMIDFFKAKASQFDFKATHGMTFDKFLKEKRINIYLDDLDRGWESKQADIKRISALLNACRDISNENTGLFFKISLRTDVYYLVRTADESTDKIENSVIWYKWDNHQILLMLIKRILTFQCREFDEERLKLLSQNQIGEYLNTIFEPRFDGKGKWNNVPTYKIFMSLVRKRPRDMVKLCTLAAREAIVDKENKITSRHLKNVFERYSEERMQDTINEYKSELPEIERLLFGMKPSQKQRKLNSNSRLFVYSTPELREKINSIIQMGKFKFSTKKIASADDLAQFLYKINFITARKELSTGEIDRKYFDENRYIRSKFADFGYEWEVHPAFRWVLQVVNLDQLYNTLD